METGYESDDEDGGSDNGDEQNLAATLAKAKKGEAGEGGGKDEKDEVSRSWFRRVVNSSVLSSWADWSLT